MKHIIFYSGGIGSWGAAIRIADKYNLDDVKLLFTDTFIEDDDLYRFLIETASKLFNRPSIELIERTRNIPDITEHLDRKNYLKDLALDVGLIIPNLVWINEGRSPWEVFEDVRWIGNSRVAPCSHILKQQTARKWIEQNYTSDECILYLGIDWTEEHRTIAPTKNWAPYNIKFPLCEAPFLTKLQLIKNLEDLEISVPKLYKEGFSHNNCGGFCVRAGQGNFIKLLETNPKLYKYHEDKEQETREFLGKDVTILKRTKNKERLNLSLRQLREEYLSNNSEDIDLLEIGGCGCFVDENADDADKS